MSAESMSVHATPMNPHAGDAPLETLLLDPASPTDGARWDAFVAGQPGVTVAHAWGWGAVIARTYGHRTHYLAAASAGQLVGVLPLTEVRSRLTGRSLTSMPYLDTGGPLAASDAARQALVDRALELARERAIRKLDLRGVGRPAVRAPVATGKVTLILELGREEEPLWKAIGAKTRNQVRKGQKSELCVLRAEPGRADDFYHVYTTNMRDLGSPPHKLAWFHALFDVFGERASCHLVHRRGETIGGLIALDLGETTTVPWASCDRRFFKLCPNNVLYWETFRSAMARGMTRFDFGRSSIGGGTYRFKKQWGAREVPLAWQELDARRSYVAMGEVGEPGASHHGEDADGAEHGRLRDLAASAWQKLPVGVATWIGTRIRGDITL